jgi:glyoxylase-like metal-dependent hydrolase (beta-lactamase superfamily II)
MNIDILVVGMFEANCLILHDDQKNALIIDPGADEASILRLIDDNRLTVQAYLLTHGHMDHVCGLAGLHKAKPAPVYLHRADAEWAFTVHNQLPPYYSQPQKPETELFPLNDRQHLSFGTMQCAIIYTPGHSPGSVCLFFQDDKLCVTGDTLFKDSVGRTDLPGGDSLQLKKSLETLQTLPDDTRILPGHGPETTLAQEKRTNVFMQGELL